MIQQAVIDKVEISTEAEHYLFIEECGGFIFHMNHEMGRDRIQSSPEILEDIKNVREIQEYVVSKLSKFGVDPLSVNDKENGSYWKWFDFWHTWHKETLTDKEWIEVNEKLQKDQPIDEYLPKIKWNDKIKGKS